MTIGVLTGGGDCPGLNPAIKAIVYKAHQEGVKILGIKDGWKGFLEADPSYIVELTPKDVRTIDRTGGTILGTSRTNPFKKEDGVNKILEKIKKYEIDALITIGGEDTLSVANRLWKEYNVPVVAIPKTIDRDLSGTSYTLGFETAVQIITEAIDSLRTTAGSHSRIFVVETMGRDTGHLALKGGLAGGATIILIPEYVFDVDHVCKLLLERKSAGERYSIVVVAEGCKPKGVAQIVSEGVDEFGHPRLGGIALWLANEIKKRTGLDTRHVILSHLQRGGAPVAYDRRMGFYFGTSAVESVILGKFGMLTALIHGEVSLIPLEEAISILRKVDVEKNYDTEKYNFKRKLL